MKAVGDKISTSNGNGIIAFVGLTERFGGISYFYSVSYLNSTVIDFVKA